MNPKRLLALFNRTSQAPDAVARLRRFVLELAVRGRLIAQNATDDPATECMRRLVAERERLVKRGTIRRTRTLPEGADDFQRPFDLPSTWTWCSLSDVGLIVGGGTPPSGEPDNFSKPGTGIAWLTPADLGRHAGLYVRRGARDLSPKGFRASSATLMPRGTVLFSSRAPIGYTAIAEGELTTNQGFKSVVPFIPESNRFIAIYLRAFAPWIDEKASGTTFREVSGKTVAGLPFPLPPLAEQHRIVAKVDELMALCDRLEAAQAEREGRRDRLVAASLRRLSEPTRSDRNSSRSHARFHLDHLPSLTARIEHIKQLRRAILGLAVRGDLARQDPTDLATPSFEAAESSASGRLEMDLPRGWNWVRVREVAEARLGKMLDKARNKGTPFRYVGNTNVHWFEVRIGDLKRIRLEDDEKDKYLLRTGDVLICEGGHGIGRTAVWRSADDGTAFQKALHRVRPGSLLESDFFAYCMFVYFDEGVLQKYFTGVGIPHFTGKALADLAFPLPPLAEQHRIVAKVDQLMAICDQLEAQIQTTRMLSRRLLEALLHEALEPAA